MNNPALDKKLQELKNKATQLRNNGNQQEIAYSIGVYDTVEAVKEFFNGAKKETKKIRKLYGRR
jgi:septation ring formation regulator EzrA